MSIGEILLMMIALVAFIGILRNRYLKNYKKGKK